MSLWKRGEWYWSDFTVNGTRYRLPLETKDQREAKAREKDKIADARDGKLASSCLSFARLGFETALDRYLIERQTRIAYARYEAAHAKPIKAFFKGRRLNQLGSEDIRLYQVHRLQQGKKPKTVNHEIKILLQLLKRAKLLSRIRDDVKLLPVVKEPREMLTAAEKQRLFETAARKSEWQTAYCAALLTANTSMRPSEIRRLLWRDFDPVNRLVTVRKSKTEAGSRVIPLNDEAWSAFAALKRRADKMEVYAPEYYIFHRQFPKIDATRPMTAWRSAWRSLRAEAAKENEGKGREAMPKLARLRFYDLRHQCITEMLEAGIPEGVIREVAGHVDPAMTRHYSHPRLAARRAAVEVLLAVKVSPQQALPEGSYVTNHVTKVLPAATLVSSPLASNPGSPRN